MKIEELKKIVEPTDHSWIKVKAFKLDPFAEDITYEEYARKLEDHHKIETEFLINKCRELAKLALNFVCTAGYCSDDELPK